MAAHDRAPASAARPERSRRALPVFVGLSVALSFFLALGRAPLFDVDEGAFSETTVEMLQRGDFVSPVLNGEPRYDKPILIYWLQAASVRVLGVGEFAFRLPSALAAVAWVVLTGLFVRRYYGATPALLAAGMLATSVGVHLIGRAATADALLNLCLAAAMFAAWRWLNERRRVWLYASSAAIGVGCLAKGPVAILIPLAVTGIYCARQRRVSDWLRAVFDPIALVVFAAIALPWYVVMLNRDGWAFVQGFLLRHNVDRFAGPLQGHGGSLVYYVPMLAAATLPYSSLLVAVLARLRDIWRDDLQSYLLLWCGFVFVFFSLSGTKLPHYVLYGITGLFILMATRARDDHSRAGALAPALGVLGFLLALPWIASAAAPRVSDPYYQELAANFGQYVHASSYAYGLSAIAVTVWLMWDRRVALVHARLLTGLVLVVWLAAWLTPAAGALQQQPIKDAAAIARRESDSVIRWRLNAPSFSVYFGRPTESGEPRRGAIVATKSKFLPELAGWEYRVLYAKNGIALLRINP